MCNTNIKGKKGENALKSVCDSLAEVNAKNNKSTGLHIHIGAKLPNERILDACRVANPHGCGFVTPTKFYKGLSYAEFLSRLSEVTEKEPCIIHFRFATNGSVCNDNCHPFYDYNIDTAFAHNGVLALGEDYRRYQDEENMTDSEYAFKFLFAPAIAKSGLNSKALKKAVESVIGWSKFAFLKGDRIKMFGNFAKLGGCYLATFAF